MIELSVVTSAHHNHHTMHIPNTYSHNLQLLLVPRIFHEDWLRRHTQYVHSSHSKCLAVAVHGLCSRCEHTTERCGRRVHKKSPDTPSSLQGRIRKPGTWCISSNFNYKQLQTALHLRDTTHNLGQCMSGRHSQFCPTLFSLLQYGMRILLIDSILNTYQLISCR
jgi:hypothetical protein